MDPELKQLMQDNLALSQDNNKILHSLRRTQRWNSFMRILYLLTIVAIAFGSYYFVQPYVNQAQKFVKDSSATIDKIKSVLPKQ